MEEVFVLSECSEELKPVVAIKEFNRPLGRCAKCQELCHHDSRKCGRVKENELEKELEKEKEKSKGKGKEKC